MRWFLSRLFGWLRGHRPRISCDTRVWGAGVGELERRTLHGRRESGAFLLGRNEANHRRILEFVFYDDIDPHALDTGIVHFHGNKLPKLWEQCRTRGFGVVADVHVHPEGFWQSESDQEDPVIPQEGHLAFILPHYAQREIKPGGIGMYEYLGNRAWRDHTSEGTSFFRLD